jgi:amicoumacin kinase
MRRTSAIDAAKMQTPQLSAPQREIARALSSDVVERAARYWDASLESLSLLPAVQNFVYSIDSAEGPAILRLTHESHRSVGEVEAELHWIADLAVRKINVARPRRSRSRSWLETIESAHGRFIATCFERAPGVAFDPSRPEMWNESVFESWGVLIGQLHAAARDSGWSQRSLRRPSWRGESVVQNFNLFVPESETLVRAGFDRVIGELDGLPRSLANYGLIHADLNQDNLFVDGDRLTVFDFDDCCFCWFAYDLAVAIYHVPPADNQGATNAKAQRVLHSLVCGYERVSHFGPEWLEWIPLFLKWRDLLIYSFYYQQLETNSLPEQFQKKFLAMRKRIEADQPIVDVSATSLPQ